MTGTELGQLPILALILFLPWFTILGALFLIYPRQPRGGVRLAFDLVALVVSVAAFVAALHWSFDHADRAHGHLWPQVLATSVGYGVFLAAMTAAFLIRRGWLRRRLGAPSHNRNP